MKAKSVTASDSSKAKFIGLFVTSVVLCVVVTSAFWGQLPGSASYKADRYSNGNGGTTRSEVTVMPDSAVNNEQRNIKIATDAEKSLLSSMDSLHIDNSAERNAQVNNTLALFREAIKNPNSISLINDALKNKNKTGVASQDEIARLKDEILVKDGQIVSLHDQLKTTQKGVPSTQPDVRDLQKQLQDKQTQITALLNQVKTTPKDKQAGGDPQALEKMKDEIQTKEAQITKLMNQLKSRPNAGNAGTLMEENKKLADENNFLKWAVRSEVSSNHNLTNLNNSLKQANATLLNQVGELKKNQ